MILYPNKTKLFIALGLAIDRQFPIPEWASFRQWKSKGESVRKGEKGSMVVYYDTIEREDDDGELRKTPFLKTSTVFNRCQLASFAPDDTPEPEVPSSTFGRMARADAFVATTGAVIEHRQGGPCYVPGEDKIFVPPPEDFFDTKTCTAGGHYYAELHHELVHWLGVLRSDKGCLLTAAVRRAGPWTIWRGCKWGLYEGAFKFFLWFVIPLLLTTPEFAPYICVGCDI